MLAQIKYVLHALQVRTVILSSTLCECHFRLQSISRIVNWTLDYKTQELKNLFPLHVLQTFFKVYSFFLSPFHGNE